MSTSNFSARRYPAKVRRIRRRAWIASGIGFLASFLAGGTLATGAAGPAAVGPLVWLLLGAAVVTLVSVFTTGYKGTRNTGKRWKR
jgi:hypothetical protein